GKVGWMPPPAAAAPVATAATAAGTSTTITTTLLEPADLGLRYSLTPTHQDLNFQLDSLTLRLSPAALHLLLQLQDMVLQPLMAPPPDKPLTRCDRFERLWSSHWGVRQAAGGGGGGGGGGPGRGVWGLELGVSRVDSMADERGVTLWRPQPAQGYVALGDVLTAGTHMPSCQVATLAVNSGLVAFPAAFDLVWQ
ncbi:hypothetical protein Vretifemale_13319, partial [Volvox reticuliferus]